MRRKKLKIGSKKTTESKAISGWGDLDSNLLLKIFQLLDPGDILSSVSLVCRWWKSVCSDVLFWKDHETLELSKLKLLVGGRIERMNHTQRLLKALKCMMNWQGVDDQRCVRSIIFPSLMYVSDVHLSFIAERSPKLKKLILPDAFFVTMSGISEAIPKWRELEELSIGPVRDFLLQDFIEKLSSSCPNLRTLCVYGSYLSRFDYFQLDTYVSLLIAKSLQQLKVLSIENAPIYKIGVENILTKCKNLEKLKLYCCSGIVDTSTSVLDDLGYTLGNGMSVEITRHKSSNSVKWCVGSQDKSFTSEEVVNLLWKGVNTQAVGITCTWKYHAWGANLSDRFLESP